MDLFSRYGDVEDAPPPPVLPSWCTESDDTPNEDTQLEGMVVQLKKLKKLIFNTPYMSYILQKRMKKKV